MSAVDLARPRRLVSTRFLRSELMLIFGRRRNWAGLAVLCAVPILLTIAVSVGGHRNSGGGPDFVSSITSNGFFVALAALTLEVPLFLPIAVAAISADSLAGEANLGTMRYLLSVPVGRTRMLLVKYTAVVIFAFAAAFLVAVVAVVAGLLVFGGGPVTLLSGASVPLTAGLARLVVIYAYVAVGLCALAAVGVFVSSLTEQPIGATIAIVILSVGSFIADSIPQLSVFQPYLLTHYWLSYADLLRSPVPLDGIGHGLITAGAYIAIFLSAAWARFGGRDVTS